MSFIHTKFSSLDKNINKQISMKNPFQYVIDKHWKKFENQTFS